MKKEKKLLFNNKILSIAHQTKDERKKERGTKIK
jgi:hypothetical protein